MPVAVTQRGYNLQNTGSNPNETGFTIQSIKTKGLTKRQVLHTPGDQRGCEAAPLFVPHVITPLAGVRDLIILADMSNTIHGYDANSGQLLWRNELGPPVHNSKQLDGYLINDHWGILSTPVIDLAANRGYCVTWSSVDGNPQNAVHELREFDIRTGKELRKAIPFTNVSVKSDQTTRQWNTKMRKQRCSLLFFNKTVFVGAGTVSESGVDCRGWVVAFDTEYWANSATWATTLRGQGAGIWQAGAPLVADNDGYIYAMTSNGDFDGVHDFGQSFVKLAYTRPAMALTGEGLTLTKVASLTCVDHWTPFTDDGRVYLDPRGYLGETPLPTNVRVYTLAMNAGWWDQDIGSGGPVVLESHGTVVGAGKDGVLYSLKRNKMGKTMPDDLVDPSQNYAKLTTPPFWWTYYPGPDFDPAPQDPALLNANPFGATHHQHGSPCYWKSNRYGDMMFCMGENGNLRSWAVKQDTSMQFLASSDEIASADAPRPPGGMPGGMLAVTGNNGENGLVFASVPYGDANTAITQGRFLVYDAQNFVPRADGTMRMVPLFDSQQWGWNYKFNKFCPPVVANGKCLLNTYQGEVWVLE